jgi:hypothetical protein
VVPACGDHARRHRAPMTGASGTGG